MAMSAQLRREDSMKITMMVFLFCVGSFNIEAATRIFPASTNANNTFFEGNEFKKTPTVNGVQVITNAGQNQILESPLSGLTSGTNTTLSVCWPTNAGSTAIIALSTGGTYRKVSTNAAFAWSGFSGLSATGLAWNVTFVTNTSGSPILATPPAGAVTNGTFSITNLSVFSSMGYGTEFTNMTGASLK